MIADDLLFTYRKYPLMRAQDFVKMLYQGEYGGAHGNNDDLAAADSLKKEIKSMKPLQGGACRGYFRKFCPRQPETFRRVG